MRALVQPLACLALVFVPPASWETQARTREVLQSGDYAYCRDGTSEALTRAEAIWCPLADEFDLRCPGLADACSTARLRGCDVSGAGPCPADGTPRGCGADGSEPCGARELTDDPRGPGGRSDAELGLDDDPTASEAPTAGDEPALDGEPAPAVDGERREAGRDAVGDEGEVDSDVDEVGELDELDRGSTGTLGTRPRLPIDRNLVDRQRRARGGVAAGSGGGRTAGGEGRSRRIGGEGNGDGAGSAGEPGGGPSGPVEGDDDAGAKASAEPRDDAEVEVPAGMSALAKLALAALLALALFLIARAVYRNLGVEEDADAGPADEPDLDAGRAADEGARARGRAVETDLERLLRRARDAAARGDHEQAIDDAFAALLRGLEGVGKIEVSASRTHGDYLGDLRGEPALRARVREIVHEVEPVQFGATPADASRFQRVLRAVEAIVRPGTALLLALVVGASLGLGCDLPRSDAGVRGRASGVGPLDSGALIELLERSDLDIRARRTDLDDLGATNKAIVLLEGLVLEPAEWERLLSWTQAGGTLIAATGVALPPELGVRTQISTSRHVHLAGAALAIESGRLQVPTGTMLELDGELAGASRTLLTRGPDPAAFADEPAPEDRAEPYAVELRRGTGTLLVFADGQLFTNASLGVADNADYVVALLGPHERVELVDELTGIGAENPLAGLLDSHFAPIFLQLLAFVGLLFLWRGWPFARLRDPIAAHRRAFVDHVRALADRYARARASRHVAHHYARWFLDHSARTLGRRSGTSLHQLAQALAVRSGKDDTEVMRLLVAAHDLATSGVGANTAEDFETVQRLSALLRQAGLRRSPR